MKGLCVVLAVLLVHLCHGSPMGSARREEQDTELVVLNYVPADGVPNEISPYRIGSYVDISEYKLRYGSQGNRHAEDYHPRIRKRRFLKGVFNKVKQGVKTVGRTIKKGAANVGRGVKTVGKTIRKGATNVGRGFKTVGKTIKKGATNAGRGIKKAAKTVGRKIWEGR